MVHPDNSKVYFDIAVMAESSTAPVGHKVLIKVCNWDTKPPEGRIREIIGKAGDHETEMRAIVAAKGVR